LEEVAEKAVSWGQDNKKLPTKSATAKRVEVEVNRLAAARYITQYLIITTLSLTQKFSSPYIHRSQVVHQQQ
jgi:hypothetical protein